MHTKITQALVDGLQFQDATTWYHDTELSGFNLSVGRRTKTYYAAGEHRGRFVRVKIGRADVTKANEARRIARDELLPAIRRGEDPRPPKAVVVKDASPLPTPGEIETFAQTFHQYRHFGTQARSKTLVEYDRTLRTKVGPWFDRPTASITADEVLVVWRREQRGSVASAKALMRIFSAVMHDAHRRKVIASVPTSSLPRGWSTVVRNPKRIGDVWNWWRLVDQIDNLHVKSALKLLLLTGLRKAEVLSLRWEDVDLDAGKVHIRNPKRGPARDAALSSWSVAQLKRLHRIKDTGFFVFPSHSSTGYRLDLPNLKYKGQVWTPRMTRNEWDSTGAEIGVIMTQRAAQMGHAAGSMTDSYVVTPDVRAAVQAVADEIMQRVKGAV